MRVLQVSLCPPVLLQGNLVHRGTHNCLMLTLILMLMLMLILMIMVMLMLNSSSYFDPPAAWVNLLLLPAKDPPDLPLRF